jgi:hypothetical protein
MLRSIPITQFSEEYRASWFFGKTYWFPFGVWIDWASSPALSVGWHIEDDLDYTTHDDHIERDLVGGE